MTTNVPFPSFTDTGFVSPEELAVVAGVLADFNEAFGGNLNPSLSTPHGQLAMSFGAVIGAFNDLFALYQNQTNPAFATGRMQDALARIYFLSRLGATPTVVEATLSGATSAIIPVGSLAVANDGTIFQSLSQVVIPPSGTINTQFAALTSGPIACPAGSLNRIYRTVAGWDSITNAADGQPGRDEESAADLERRRVLSVAGNAAGILPAVRGAVLSVPGVVDAYVTENTTGSNVTIGTQVVKAHSLYVGVEGGTDLDVARAIWSKKNPGCDYSGATTVTIEDTNSGYLTPPTYDVTFRRVDALTVNFVVQIANTSAVPSDAAAQVTAAITANFPALAKIGQAMYASSYVCPIAALGTWARIVAVTVNAGAAVTVGINQFPALGTVSVSLV